MDLSNAFAQSYFVEILMLAISTRLVWTQVLNSELKCARWYPLSVYFFMCNSLMLSHLEKEISLLRSTEISGLDETLGAEKRIKEVVFRYNMLSSESRLIPNLLFIVISVFILKFNPFMFTSFIISDLVTTRIHQHITSSF